MCDISIKTYPVNSLFYRACLFEGNPFYIDKYDRSLQSGNWANSFYFFLDKCDLKKYDDDIDHPLKMSLKNSLKPINYIEHLDPSFDYYDNDSMQSLINKIKTVTGISTNPSENMFMYWLGENGYAFQFYEDEEQSQAIAIPFQLKESFDICDYQPVNMEDCYKL